MSPSSTRRESRAPLDGRRLAARVTERALRALAVLAAAAACLAGCANQLVQQHANPDYVGKPFKRVLVVAVTNENVLSRIYEDRMVALLATRGVQGVQGYDVLGTAGAVDRATLRAAIAKTGVEGVLITRTLSADQATLTTGATTVTWGYGWGGFYDYYRGAWQTKYVPAQTTATGPTRIVTETRLFDAKTGTLAWSGLIDTLDRDSTDSTALPRYAPMAFDAMVRDRIF
jgi:hypothetical protein